MLSEEMQCSVKELEFMVSVLLNMECNHWDWELFIKEWEAKKLQDRQLNKSDAQGELKRLTKDLSLAATYEDLFCCLPCSFFASQSLINHSQSQCLDSIFRTETRNCNSLTERCIAFIEHSNLSQALLGPVLFREFFRVGRTLLPQKL
ncbi:hypothetical protein SLEP1_g1793 [Rubroshorea leprosula]|uniref:Uncharacterized protein n=1 Tax=Rubroshorea leprosula TaxID=152421 RepID=A0AAV5HNR2_9ROSI|nr:hypothetical protein SLEP1_g1793 [Rubroshorea leprosula]